MRKKIIGVMIFLIIFSTFSFLFWREIDLPVNPDSKSKIIFSIKKGEGTRDIANNLEKAGLIRFAPLLRLYSATIGVAGSMKAGDYELSQSLSMADIVAKIVAGDVIKDQITIIEGWNVRDIAAYFEQNQIAKTEDLFKMVGFPAIDYSSAPGLPLPKDFSSEVSILNDKPKNVGLEGYLFPDTYEIKRRESVEDIIKRILANTDQKISLGMRSEIYRQKKTVFDIITAASLIEKEVRTLEDKKIVSGIMLKRLKQGMPLQIDATISYITGKKTSRISLDELAIDSPYNTYKYKGLPIAPISNPGLDSIVAAVYPQDSDYWFYLSSPDGRTIFSKTLAEHNIAREKYLK